MHLHFFTSASCKINIFRAQHFIVSATKSTFSRPSILLYLPKNQQFPCPAFYCSSCKINIFQAQNFIVPPKKSTIPGPSIVLCPLQNQHFPAPDFIVPGQKTNSFWPHHFIVPAQPGCKINDFWPQHFIPVLGSKIYNFPAQAQLPHPSRVISLVRWTCLQQVKIVIDMGNPWVFLHLPLPLPLPMKTHTHSSWV